MRLLFSVFLFFTLFCSQAQDKYWVFLSDKDTVGYNPYTFFDAKAIERRVKNEIPVFDLSDVPVNQYYVQVLAGITDSISFASRWFNAVCLYADNEQIERISTLPFVTRIELSSCPTIVLASDTIEENLTYLDSLLLHNQIAIMQGEKFREAGITGKGVRIAIFDGGFPNVDVLPCFKHIRDNNRIIKTYDFTRKKENVYGFSSHGTTVLCCIAGMSQDGIPFGMATDAEFLLARTEVNAEPFSEEENWVAALEWADQNGADIVNSSLGYTNNRYFPYDMDGKTSFVTRGANIAAAKGILVVNAAGNDGDSKWKLVGAPADADSILSVGGVDPFSETHINFSSFGPTADGRMKPNVCAAGQVFAYGKKGPGTHYGTSFASPLTAGFAACAMQAHPTVKAWDMFQEIQQSGNLYPYYDYAHGYGIPQASFFTEGAPDNSSTEVSIKLEGDNIVIFLSPMPLPEEKNVYCYVHCSEKSGLLKWYKVMTVQESKALEMPSSQFKEGQILRVHYKGVTQEYSF